jgi:hypothetical protein
MNLKHISNEQLLQELDSRINQDIIDLDGLIKVLQEKRNRGGAK